jgi:pimeloyl-ACP methyl ester carboxylesterase
MLLLHGITSSAASWWQVAPALARQGYHVFAFDMPGHGLSDTTDDHRIDAIAATVAAAARARSLDNPVVIGHSWGGATTLALATATAQRLPIARAALIDPAMRMNGEWGTEALPRYLDGVGQPPEQTLPTVRANNPDWHECDVFWKGESLAQCRDTAVRGFFTQSGDWNFAPRLAEVEVPLLLLVADPQYTVIPPEIQAEAEAALRPGLGTMHTITGTTHSMQRGNGFGPTMEAISNWLAQ